MRLSPVPAHRAAALAAVAGACLILAPLAAHAVDAATETGAETAPMKAAMAEYRRKLAEYTKAYDAFDKIAGPYWRAVTDKRSRRRTKVANNMQPLGRRLRDDAAAGLHRAGETGEPAAARQEEERHPRRDDFLANARPSSASSPRGRPTRSPTSAPTPRLPPPPASPRKRRSRSTALNLGGNGKYDIQAGREYDMKARVISTALGYNQLLTTDTVGLLAEDGDDFLAALAAKTQGADAARKAALADKTAKLKKMIAFARTVPNDWNAHGRLANTPKGIGVHALNLDIDIGPLLQTRKLTTSVEFAKRKGYTAPLTAAELEMMNLTGDGNGYDMVTMPKALREKVPTTNFFQRGGYERNPVAARNNTVAKLIAATDAKMVSEAKLQGAKDLAAAFDAVIGRRLAEQRR